MYGYSSDSLKKTAGKFGLNKAVVTSFKYDTGEGQNGDYEFLQLTLNVDGKDYNKRFFPIQKVFGKENEEITDPKRPEFQKEVTLLTSTVTNFLKCFRDESEIMEALSASTDFKTYAQACEELFEDSEDKEEPIFVFLCYQWQPKKDNKKTFLEIPKNIKHGTIFCKHEDYVEEVSITKDEEDYTVMCGPDVLESTCEDGNLTFKLGDNEYGLTDNKYTPSLVYVSSGEILPVTRNSWFMGSQFANQVDLDNSDDANEEW